MVAAVVAVDDDDGGGTNAFCGVHFRRPIDRCCGSFHSIKLPHFLQCGPHYVIDFNIWLCRGSIKKLAMKCWEFHIHIEGNIT